jgi:hypothetical protein
MTNANLNDIYYFGGMYTIWWTFLAVALVSMVVLMWARKKTRGI